MHNWGYNTKEEYLISVVLTLPCKTNHTKSFAFLIILTDQIEEKPEDIRGR